MAEIGEIPGIRDGWQTKKEEMKEEIKRMNREIGFVDVFLIAGSESNPDIIPANSLILSKYSKVFAAMFKEKSAKNIEVKTNPNISSDGILALIWYFYKSEILLYSWDLMFEMYGAAKEYKVKFLISKLEDIFLEIDLSPKEAYFLLKISSSLQLCGLMNRIFHIISRNNTEVLESFAVNDSWRYSKESSELLQSPLSPWVKNSFEQFLIGILIYPETACSMLNVSLSLQMNGLKNRCLKFILEQTREVMATRDFLNTEREVIEAILKQNFYVSVASELELFNAVVAWSSNQSYKNRKHGGEIVIRNILKPLLPHVRFLSMSPDEFEACVSLNPKIFSLEERTAIAMEISFPGSHALPIWCNTCRERLYRMPSSNELCQIHRMPLKYYESSPFSYAMIERLELGYEIISELKVEALRSTILLSGFKLRWIQDETYPNDLKTLDYVITVAGPGPQYFYVESPQTVHNDEEVSYMLPIPLLLCVNQSINIRVTLSNIKGFIFLELGKCTERILVKNSSIPPFLLHLQSSSKDPMSTPFVISELFYWS